MDRSTPKRVLIVDDHLSVRRALRALLEAHGYSCDDVPDGPTALGLISKTTFDVIVTDYRMPVMDGLQFLEHVGHGAHCRSQRVILHTGSLSGPLLEKALHAGACRVLSKPSTPNEFLAAVAQALEAR